MALTHVSLQSQYSHIRDFTAVSPIIIARQSELTEEHTLEKAAVTLSRSSFAPNNCGKILK